MFYQEKSGNPVGEWKKAAMVHFSDWGKNKSKNVGMHSLPYTRFFSREVKS
jgi:hypothetical protein